MRIGSGIECTTAQGQPGFEEGDYNDELRATGHHLRYWEDFKLIWASGVRDLRIPVMWPLIQRKRSDPPEKWDFSWTDRYVNAALIIGFRVTLDMCHHTNGPADVSLGDPSMPERMEEFTLACLARYPGISAINIMNEPFTNALFCSRRGVWYPHQTSDRDFVQTAIAIGKTICRSSRVLDRHPEYTRICQYYNDSCEAHSMAPIPYRLDAEAEGYVRFQNELRFLMADMVLGMIDDSHPLLWFLRLNGYTEETQKWFQENPARIDRFGCDFYDRHCHSYAAFGDLSWLPGNRPRGLADILVNDYYARYKDRVGAFVVGETNLYGSDPEKWTWFLFCWAECVRAGELGCPIEQLDWQGFFGGKHWMHEMCKPSREFCDFGVAWLRPDPVNSGQIKAHTGLFYEEFKRVATDGGNPFENQIAYRFKGAMAERLQGFIEGPMARYGGWEWRDPPY